MTGAEAFRNLRTWLGEHDVTLSLSRVRPSVRARFERFGLLDGVEVYDTNRQAVRSVRDGGPRGAGAHPTD
ncbi:STAS domain-containing protein [Agromyces marinus]|uniref:STAS domain-containing protein n=1 Tax=Agromyces marinus TaxID=1389020 RepID=UPI002572C25F|nr:STAS domain-containing protein [Agromyces marinus]